MTLREWCRIHGTHHTHPTTERGAVSVCVSALGHSPHVTQLWHLEDYRVDARHGVVVWLLPIPQPELAAVASEESDHERVEEGRDEFDCLWRDIGGSD